MRSHAADKVSTVKTLLQDFVEKEHAIGGLLLQNEVGHAQIIGSAQYVQIVAYTFVTEFASCETHHLVEDGECVAHAAVGLFCNEFQSFFLGFHSFPSCYTLQMGNDVARGNARKIEYLATAQYGGQNLVLLGGGKDEDDIGRRFFQRLEESIESRGAEHVYFINDKHLVASHLRRYLHLLDELTDVFHAVVAGRIQLVYRHAPAFIKGLATLALSACITSGCG